jgi:hypothetical protein
MRLTTGAQRPLLVLLFVPLPVLLLVPLFVAAVSPRAAAERVPPPERPRLDAKLDQAVREARKALERSEPARVRDRVPTARQIDRAAGRREQDLKGALGQFHLGGSSPRSRDEQVKLLTELLREAPGIIKGKAEQWREVLPGIREELAELLRQRPPDDAPDDVKQEWLDNVRDLTDSIRRNLNIKRSAEVTVPAAERQAEDAGLPERLVDESLAEAGLTEEPAPADAPAEPPAGTPESHLDGVADAPHEEEAELGDHAGGAIVVGPLAPPEEDGGHDHLVGVGAGADGSAKGLVVRPGPGPLVVHGGRLPGSDLPVLDLPVLDLPRDEPVFDGGLDGIDFEGGHGAPSLLDDFEGGQGHELPGFQLDLPADTPPSDLAPDLPDLPPLAPGPDDVLAA